MILAHWFVSGPDPFGQNTTQLAKPTQVQAGFAQYDPGHL